MRLSISLAVIFTLSVAEWSFAQDPAPQKFEEPAEIPAKPPVISLKKPGKLKFWKDWIYLPPHLLQDQKRIWSFPVTATRRRNLKTTMALLGVTAGLVAIDGPPATYFRKTKSFDGFNKVFSGTNTAKANYMIPLAFYGIGLARRDPYAQKTFIQAGEAVLGAEVLTTVMKDIDRRWNPADARPINNYTDTWFKYRYTQHLIVGNGSMPSGHTITAFSVATVYADRYAHHRWVKWVAYGLASLDGVSRVSNQSHFSSDVFAGAALGYILAHHVVLGGHK